MSACISSTQRSMAAIAILLLLLAGCASPRVTQSWRSPTLTGPMHFKKIAVLVNHPDAYARKAGEDAMVAQIGADRAVAGYTFLTDADRKDINVVRSKLEAGGFDGAVTMRPAGMRSGADGPGNPGALDTFVDEYNRGVFAAPDGGNPSAGAEAVLSVRTSIYTVSDGKMIWWAVTDIPNPKYAHQIIADVAKVVSAELRKQKRIG